MGLRLAFSYKHRPKTDKAKVKIVGRISKKMVIVPDDLISSGGTLIEIATKAVKKHNSLGIVPLVTHPSPKSEAMNLIINHPHVKALVVMDTIPICFDTEIQIPKGKKLIIVDPAPIIGMAIIENQKKRKRERGSISKIYDMNVSEIGLRYWVRSEGGL